MTAWWVPARRRTALVVLWAAGNFFVLRALEGVTATARMQLEVPVDLIVPPVPVALVILAVLLVPAALYPVLAPRPGRWRSQVFTGLGLLGLLLAVVASTGPGSQQATFLTLAAHELVTLRLLDRQGERPLGRVRVSVLRAACLLTRPPGRTRVVLAQADAPRVTAVRGRLGRARCRSWTLAQLGVPAPAP